MKLGQNLTVADEIGSVTLIVTSDGIGSVSVIVTSDGIGGQ